MDKPDLPAYEQVKAFIKGHISRGDWKPGDPVPSESALGQQFGVARMTVNRALRELAAEGLVTRVQGSGTRVAQLHRISSRLTIRDIHEEMAERGHVPTTRVVLVAAEKEPAGEQAQLVAALRRRAPLAEAPDWTLRPQGALEALRDKLGVSWSARDERELTRAYALVRTAYRVLPDRLTYFPLAYHARKHHECLEKMTQRQQKSFAYHLPANAGG